MSTLSNPVILEFEASKILPQVSTYNIIKEAASRIRRMHYVDLRIIDQLDDILDGLYEGQQQDVEVA